MLVAAVGEAFRSSFLLAGPPACWPRRCWPRRAAGGDGRRRARWRSGRRAALRRAAPRDRARAAGDPGSVPPPSATLPKTGGVSGFLQDQALKLLDSAACKLGSSREELVLALADKDEAKRFEREHGVDPRTAAGLLQLLLK